jgi:dTDP-3-amino-3,4,6-trideoxy-alpha-D-glucose transaminase
VEIPVFDLAPALRRIRPQLEARWARLLEATSFVGGDEVAAFERAYARFLDAPGCVGVANGTDALTVSLRALDLKPGAEVVIPAFSFFATLEAVVLAGGRPVLADVEAGTLNLDPEDAARRVSERTAGIVTVHLYGQPSDLDRLGELCRDRSLWLLEDAAQAHGARWRGKRVGTFGELAGWSFYPSKNLGCFGDGGAVTGRDEELLARVRLLANHGQSRRYEHQVVGTNSRLDALQAAVLALRLEHLEADNERRRALAAVYREELEGVGDLELLRSPDHCQPVYHQFTVMSAARDALREALAADGIGTAVHYPLPFHLLPAVRELLDDRPELPGATAAAERVLSLPMFPELERDQVGRVCAAIRGFFGRS